ncbi:phage protein [gut metagenome]|uniref:Phage protein n=1 Tax=gut metagenome TaxID=749906 RepID=J9GJV7_9ZZZZ
MSKSEENIETSAKKWASALSDKTARAKAEEAARIIIRHGIELPVIKESGRMKKRTLAQFRSDGTPTIEVNKKLNDDFWKRDAKSVEIGWAAQDNPILHELGHYIDFICNKEKYNKQSENKRFFGETKSLIEKEVSIYAATDQWELEAELYAGIMRGKVYSNNVLNLSRISQSDNDIIKRLLSYGTGQDVCLPSEDISKQFKNMMKVLFQQEGSSFSINIMADKDVQKMIETHSSVLNGSFRQVEMSEAMRKRLERSNYVFSGLKTFHELNEAFPSLLDEDGNRKTFERFLNDVRKIDKTYNSNYLRAEFNFVQASSEMAAKWERFIKDGDRYYLQYRTAGDAKVRPTHAEMAGITLPVSDLFWTEFYPPNGWGCRCSVVQVRKSKYPATDHEEAMARGESALGLDKKGMFRFNAGMEQKTMPDYNPYTIKRCKDCDIAKGKLKLAKSPIPDNELCEACQFIRICEENKGCFNDELYGNRLKISKDADKTEVQDNIRAAYAMLESFPEMVIKVRENVLKHGVKNPEYMINGMIADRKGIESPKGIQSGFKKAIKQGCQVVVIDLDMHMKDKKLPVSELAKYINWRSTDFEEGTIKECYVIHQGKAVKITADDKGKDTIANIIEKLKP